MLFERIDRMHPLYRLRDEVDRLFNEFYGEGTARSAFNWITGRVFPALNVWEDDQNVYAEAEVPGMSMENLEVLVMANELTVKGERAKAGPEGVSYHRRERGTGTFCRTVRLPVEVNADKVSAALKDGVLTITMPKAEVARPRKIEVKGQ